MKILNNKLDEVNEAANTRQEKGLKETERLKAEIKELREELSEVAMSEYEGIESGRSLRNFKIEDGRNLKIEITQEDLEIQRLNGELLDLSLHSCPDVERLQRELEIKRKDFELERLTWAQEKEKVLRYQRQLQLSYVQMFRRTRNLETEIESLNLELEMCNKDGAKKMPSIELAHTVEL